MVLVGASVYDAQFLLFVLVTEVSLNKKQVQQIG